MEEPRTKAKPRFEERGSLEGWQTNTLGQGTVRTLRLFLLEEGRDALAASSCLRTGLVFGRFSFGPKLKDKRKTNYSLIKNIV